MKQIEDAKLFGIQGFCKDLLEVLSVFYNVHNTFSMSYKFTISLTFVFFTHRWQTFWVKLQKVFQKRKLGKAIHI